MRKKSRRRITTPEAIAFEAQRQAKRRAAYKKRVKTVQLKSVFQGSAKLLTQTYIYGFKLPKKGPDLYKRFLKENEAYLKSALGKRVIEPAFLTSEAQEKILAISYKLYGDLFGDGYTEDEKRLAALAYLVQHSFSIVSKQSFAAINFIQGLSRLPAIEDDEVVNNSAYNHFQEILKESNESLDVSRLTFVEGSTWSYKTSSQTITMEVTNDTGVQGNSTGVIFTRS